MDIIKAKLDVVFKKLFTSDNDVLKAFIADILDIPKEDITQINVENPGIVPPVPDGKQSVLDLKMRVDDKLVNVEIQLSDKGNFRERSLYYWSKVFSDELKKGKDYVELKKTITINILDFNLFDCEEIYSKFSMYEEKRHELLTDKCLIMYFELSKVNGDIDKNDRKKLWMQLINAETEEELDMLERTGIPEIGKAVVILHEMSADEEMREMARLREKAEHDMISMQNHYTNIGEARGIVKGKAEEREKIVANLRKKGLSEEEIRNLLD